VEFILSISASKLHSIFLICHVEIISNTTSFAIKPIKGILMCQIMSTVDYSGGKQFKSKLYSVGQREMSQNIIKILIPKNIFYPFCSLLFSGHMSLSNLKNFLFIDILYARQGVCMRTIHIYVFWRIGSFYRISKREPCHGILKIRLR
jgi:hypothetical protein